MIVYFAFIFLFDFTSCHTICLLVLVNSDAHFGSGVIINLEILKTTTIKKKDNINPRFSSKYKEQWSQKAI